MKNKLTITGKAEIDELTIGAKGAGDDLKKIADLAGDMTNEVNLNDGKIKDAVVGARLVIHSPSELTSHIEKLESDVIEAEAVGELDKDQAQDAHTALARAKEEAKKPEPASKRLLENLKRVSDIFEQVKKSTENVQKIGKVVVKAAPYAAMVYNAAKTFLGV